ncbi:hypothetical protein AKJ38_01660 [candidate division MSBL1 archaeon SCGC-AAA259I14]|uniref:Uncharacterized protein n=1 Tax=candidate division MSBL1 archaeon SCGC-AAA259I14 TaxID=1698268 RepID=A0A133USN8_9EURY|nr:hypothetical protein AKJ38_01660 [candidate division MSBL1 archaeon SCGC-AAA259I14]
MNYLSLTGSVRWEEASLLGLSTWRFRGGDHLGRVMGWLTLLFNHLSGEVSETKNRSITHQIKDAEGVFSAQ